MVTYMAVLGLNALLPALGYAKVMAGPFDCPKARPVIRPVRSERGGPHHKDTVSGSSKPKEGSGSKFCSWKQYIS